MLSIQILPATTSPRATLVLLHAFPLSSKMWEGPAAELQSLRDDTEIWLVELPGFGESEYSEAWTMLDVATELNEHLSHVRNAVVLGGLSMGGYVALEYYRQFGSRLAGLILCDTKAEADTEAQKRLRSQFAADALKRGPQAAIDRLYPNFVTENTLPETAIAIQDWIMQAKPQVIANALIAMRDRRDNSDILPLMVLPVSVIVGEKDATSTPDLMRNMAEMIPNSSFEVIAGTAHLSAVEAPEQWAGIVGAFLDRILGS